MLKIINNYTTQVTQRGIIQNLWTYTVAEPVDEVAACAFLIRIRGSYCT